MIGGEPIWTSAELDVKLPWIGDYYQMESLSIDTTSGKPEAFKAQKKILDRIEGLTWIHFELLGIESNLPSESSLQMFHDGVSLWALMPILDRGPK